MKEYHVINILEGIYEDYVRDNDKEYTERNLALTEAVKALTEIQQYRAAQSRNARRQEKSRGRRNLSMTGYMPAPTATQSCCKALLKQGGNAVRNVGRHWIGVKRFERHQHPNRKYPQRHRKACRRHESKGAEAGIPV